MASTLVTEAAEAPRPSGWNGFLHDVLSQGGTIECGLISQTVDGTVLACKPQFCLITRRNCLTYLDSFADPAFFQGKKVPVGNQEWDLVSATKDTLVASSLRASGPKRFYLKKIGKLMIAVVARGGDGILPDLAAQIGVVLDELSEIGF